MDKIAITPNNTALLPALKQLFGLEDVISTPDFMSII
jgi:hypothetical protein